MASKAKPTGNGNGNGKQSQGKPNILVIWGDDIGLWNISAYNQGMMGYLTPNIDRIAKEGAMMTDCYGQQSCTAGRAAFITGMNPLRTGLTTIGMPGAKYGLQDSDPTIAEMLKPLGYTCGHFGKNHVGDSNPYLPTVHGFDEFFGNLYHLNAEGEPECPDYPKDPTFKERFDREASSGAGPRTAMTPPRTSAGAWWASSASRTPARSLASAWRPWTGSSSRGPWTSWSAP